MTSLFQGFNLIKFENSQLFSFPKVWKDHKKFFPGIFSQNFLSDLRENLIDDYYNRNNCINQRNCFVCNRLKDIKNDYIK